MAPHKSEGKLSAEMPVQVQAQSTDFDIDYEKHGAQREANPLPDLKRKLKSRHLQMIAIGELDDIVHRYQNLRTNDLRRRHNRYRFIHW